MTQPAAPPDPTHYRLRYAVQIVCGVLAFIGVAIHFLQGFGFDMLGIPSPVGNWLIVIGGLCGLASTALPSILAQPHPERLVGEAQIHRRVELRKAAVRFSDRQPID